jgi:predicted transcriptional regulator
MLLRLSNAYDIDVRDFVAGADEASTRDLQEIFSDRLLADIGTARHEILEVAENHPGVSEAIARLYRALGDLRRLPDRVEQLDADSTGSVTPLEWLRRALEQQRNHFPDLDSAAEKLSEELGEGPQALMSALPSRLSEHHGISVRVVPQNVLIDALWHYDFHRRRLMLSERLSMSSRMFGMAHQLALEALSGPLEAAALACAPPDAEASWLLRTALANHGAAAIVMPYSRFQTSAEECRYDLRFLRDRFGVSLEQAAHRLTTLLRPSQKGPGLFLLKVDSSGNVSKRFAIENAPLPRTAGGCPRWNVQRALHSPGKLVVELVENTNGARFLTVAFAVESATGHASVIVIGCSDKNADRLVYNDALQGKDPLPVGIACNVCTRQHCPQRSMPPITRTLDFRSYQRTAAPYPFLGT